MKTRKGLSFTSESPEVLTYMAEFRGSREMETYCLEATLKRVDLLVLLLFFNKSSCTNLGLKALCKSSIACMNFALNYFGENGTFQAHKADVRASVSTAETKVQLDNEEIIAGLDPDIHLTYILLGILYI